MYILEYTYQMWGKDTDYTKLENKITVIDGKITKLEIEIDAIKRGFMSLRSWCYKRMEQEDEEDSEEEEETGMLPGTQGLKPC